MSHSHEKVETNVGLMAALIAVALSFGGLAEGTARSARGPVL